MPDRQPDIFAFFLSLQEKAYTLSSTPDAILGKHLLFTSWIFFTVGAVNFLYSHSLGFVPLNPSGFFYFQLVTLLVGIFPVGILILVNYAYLIT